MLNLRAVTAAACAEPRRDVPPLSMKTGRAASVQPGPSAVPGYFFAVFFGFFALAGAAAAAASSGLRNWPV